MTALRLEAATPRIRNPRTARTATQRRMAGNARSRYSTVTRITICTAVGLAVLLLYVLLIANITSLSYAVDRVHAERSAVRAQVARDEDEIASLTADDRLAAVAARLHMVQPTQFLRISLVPKPAVQGRPLAFLSR